jgi:hypothetical protein
MIASCVAGHERSQGCGLGGDSSVALLEVMIGFPLSCEAFEFIWMYVLSLISFLLPKALLVTI